MIGTIILLHIRRSRLYVLFPLLLRQISSHAVPQVSNPELASGPSLSAWLVHVGRGSTSIVIIIAAACRPVHIVRQRTAGPAGSVSGASQIARLLMLVAVVTIPRRMPVYVLVVVLSIAMMVLICGTTTVTAMLLLLLLMPSASVPDRPGAVRVPNTSAPLRTLIGMAIETDSVVHPSGLGERDALADETTYALLDFVALHRVDAARVAQALAEAVGPDLVGRLDLSGGVQVHEYFFFFLWPFSLGKV